MAAAQISRKKKRYVHLFVPYIATWETIISETRLQSKSSKRERREEQWHIAPCEQVLLGLSAVHSIGEEKEKS